MNTPDISLRIAEEAHIGAWFRLAGQHFAKIQWDGQTLLVLDGKGGGNRHERLALRICGALPADGLPPCMIWLLAELLRVNGAPAAVRPAPAGVDGWILTIPGFPEHTISGPDAAKMVNELHYLSGFAEAAA